MHNRCRMQQTPIDALHEDLLVDAVLSASRVLVAIAARSLADVGEEVTLTQYRSLVVLASRGPQGVAALAEAVSVTPPTASSMCDRSGQEGTRDPHGPIAATGARSASLSHRRGGASSTP